MTTETIKETCGIVMPISAIDGCNESHWKDVLTILKEAIIDAGFLPNLVSDSDDVGVIQKRIIQNLYDNPIIVCDVSGKNANVMFELGMRLAFDKPTIIVKDDETAYSFDTSSIEHLDYPRDLRFTDIIAFKRKLTEKITKTLIKANTDPKYTTFLKHFGEFKVAKIETKEVSSQELIIDELKSMRAAIDSMHSYPSATRVRGGGTRRFDISICIKDNPKNDIMLTKELIEACEGVTATRIRNMGEEHYHLDIRHNPDCHVESIHEIVKDFLPSSKISQYQRNVA